MKDPKVKGSDRQMTLLSRAHRVTPVSWKPAHRDQCELTPVEEMHSGHVDKAKGFSSKKEALNTLTKILLGSSQPVFLSNLESVVQGSLQ